MKTKTKILIAFGVISAMVISFMLGIMVNYPKIDSSYAGGTIGKINNYRNIKLSDEALKTYNNLISDTSKVMKLKNYYNFHYLNALKLSANLDNAINEANLVSAFKAKNQTTIDNLVEYVAFLSIVRTDLLLVLSAVNSVNEVDPASFAILTNQANNVVIQMNYRNKFIVRFIDDIGAFVNENPTLDCAGLKKYHDILTVNEVLNSEITRDKVLMKYFDKNPMFGNKENMQLYDQKKLDILMQNDVISLNFNEEDDNGYLLKLCSKESLSNTLKGVKSLSRSYDSDELDFLDLENLQIRAIVLD